MSLPLPLAVRLSTSRTDRHITADVHDLSYRSVVPGGFASATVSLSRPLDLQPDEIAYYARLYVYDRRNGSTVWEGRLEDPSRTAGPDGEVWELAAVGPSAHLQDRTGGVIYVDRSFDRWFRADNVTPGGQDDTGENPGIQVGAGEDALTLRFPQGLALVTNSRVAMRYAGLSETGQYLAAVNYRWDAGQTTVNNEVQLVTRNSALAGAVRRQQTFNTSGSAGSAKYIADFGSDQVYPELRIIRVGTAVTVGDDLSWVGVTGIYVMGQRYNADGSLKSTGYSDGSVLASDVVADLVGRWLPKYDGANASIATTSNALDQLAYPDPTNAEGILADLATLEPGYYFAAWESGKTGLHRVEYKAWPITVRYEADITDGFSSPGSATDLYNACTVRWRNVLNRIKLTRRTATVPVLDAAGLTREAMVDISDVTGSLANAQLAGDNFLAEHAVPHVAGTLTVARPVLDLYTGRLVQPWEIRPGHLLRVRGVLPRLAALNPGARDGVSTFRLVAVDFRASDGTASLELDSPPPTLARQVAARTAQPVARR